MSFAFLSAFTFSHASTVVLTTTCIGASSIASDGCTLSGVNSGDLIVVIFCGQGGANNNMFAMAITGITYSGLTDITSSAGGCSSGGYAVATSKGNAALAITLYATYTTANYVFAYDFSGASLWQFDGIASTTGGTTNQLLAVAEIAVAATSAAATPCGTYPYTVDSGFNLLAPACPSYFIGSNAANSEYQTAWGGGTAHINMYGGLSLTPNSGIMFFSSNAGGGTGDPCSIYACSTVTYSTSIITEFCVSNPSVCTNETTSTTWSFDATSTVITYTTCSTTGNGSQYCVTRTESISGTKTYTDTSVSLVTSTISTTTTATAVIAPTTNSLLYWFFGFVSLLIPPATLVGIRANQRGSTSSDDFIPLILIGLFVGSLLGLVLNVLPWEFLVAFGGILVLYVIRSRL